MLLHGVSGITDVITTPGLINLDYADVRSVMKDAGSALMGIGYATGENRARDAAERALKSPLIDTEIVAARGILLSIAGGDDRGQRRPRRPDLWRCETSSANPGPPTARPDAAAP